jgi:hypothetical protein
MKIDPNKKYYLQDARQVVGNCALWWATHNQGYTTDLLNAEIYKGSELLEKPHRDTDIPREIYAVQAAARPTVDVAQLHKKPKKKGGKK